MRRLALLAGVLAAAAVALAGCGDSSPAGPSTRLVDLSKKPPYVNALDIDPDSGDLLLTTNRGFFRIDREEGRAKRLRATISAKGKSSSVGTFLLITVTGPRTLIGSGHPDKQGACRPSSASYARTTGAAHGA